MDNNYKENFKNFICETVYFLEELLDKEGTVNFYRSGEQKLIEFINQKKFNFLKSGDRCIDRLIYELFTAKAIPLKSKTDRRFFTFKDEKEREEVIEEILQKTKVLHT